MWKRLRRKLRPSTRDLLLEIIPKVELVPVVVPDKYEIPRDFKPPEPKTVYQMDYPDYVFHDTLAASRRIYGASLPNHQLQTVAAACGYDLTRHHHALADAEACAHIALKLL